MTLTWLKEYFQSLTCILFCWICKWNLSHSSSALEILFMLWRNSYVISVTQRFSQNYEVTVCDFAHHKAWKNVSNEEDLFLKLLLCQIILALNFVQKIKYCLVPPASQREPEREKIVSFSYCISVYLLGDLAPVTFITAFSQLFPYLFKGFPFGHVRKGFHAFYSWGVEQTSCYASSFLSFSLYIINLKLPMNFKQCEKRFDGAERHVWWDGFEASSL